VTKKDLCKWNQIGPSSPLIPGSCLVFFKRSFESEPVHLARSLQPGYIAEAPRIRTASLNTEVTQPTVTDADLSDSVAEPRQQDREREKRVERSVPVDSGKTYVARRGDTLDKIARRNHMDVQLLCQLNGVKKTAALTPGQTVKISAPKMLADAGPAPSGSSRKSSSSAICFASDPKKPNSPTAAYYTAGKRETLQSVSRKSGISINVLCQLNSLKRDSSLKPGQKIKLTQANLPVKPSLGTAACSIKDSSTHQSASSARGASQKEFNRKDSKRIESKPANKAAVKSTAAAKTQDKATAKGSVSARDAVKKPAQQKAVSKEASKANKVAPAAAKKPADAKAAAVKPARNKLGQPVGQLAKNSKK
jgi:LysM repeat protein